MLKLLLRNKHKSAIILGLEGENIIRLKEGQPIKFDGREVGYEGQIVIFYADTQHELLEIAKLFET